MSYTEFHKGKFAIKARGDKDIIKYAVNNNLLEKFDLQIKGDKIENHDCYGSGPGAYNILTLHRHKPEQEYVLIQYIEHEHCDSDEFDLHEFKRTGQSEFEFMTQFYNGGCCETEIWEDELDKINFNEDFEIESEKVEITPRESYMILDCLQYVLIKMDNEKIDYLFSNYSKDEIAQLGQRFGDMNIKNQW